MLYIYTYTHTYIPTYAYIWPKSGQIVLAFFGQTQGAEGFGECKGNTTLRSVSVCIYIYIYAVEYYLVQVWPFEVLLSGPSFVLTMFVKGAIKYGVSAYFSLKKLPATFSGVIIWSKLAFQNARNLDQIITPTWTRS